MRWSQIYLRQAVGQRSGQGLASRRVISAAVTELERAGLLWRSRLQETGNGHGFYTYKLLAPTAAGPSPAFADAYRRIRGTCRKKDWTHGAQAKADVIRVLLSLDAEGRWGGRRAQLMALLGASTWAIARRRLEAVAAAAPGLTWEEQWSGGGFQISVLVPAPKETGDRAQLEAESAELLEQIGDVGGEEAMELVRNIQESCGLHLEGARKAISLGREIRERREVLRAAEEHPGKAVLVHGLRQTGKAEVVRQPDSRKWPIYMRKVMANSAGRFGARGTGPNGTAIKQDRDHAKLEARVRERLLEAAIKNGSGDFAAAREVLDLLLSHVDRVAALADGDEATARRWLLEAFDQGTGDFIRISPDPYNSFGFLKKSEPTAAAA